MRAAFNRMNFFNIKSESLATLPVWSNHSAPHQQILNPKDVGSFSGCYSTHRKLERFTNSSFYKPKLRDLNPS